MYCKCAILILLCKVAWIFSSNVPTAYSITIIPGSSNGYCYLTGPLYVNPSLIWLYRVSATEYSTSDNSSFKAAALATSSTPTGLTDNGSPTVALTTTPIDFKTTSAESNIADIPTDTPATPSYLKSHLYSELSKHFTPEEKKIDENFTHLKNFYVKTDIQANFTPSDYSIEALSVVPELFHVNFLRRGEDHWQSLMSIRQAYLERVSINKRITELIAEKRRLAKLYIKGGEPERLKIKRESLAIRDQLRNLRISLTHIKARLANLREKLPNLLDSEVPTEASILLREYKQEGEGPKSQDNIQPHFSLFAHFSGLETDQGSEIAGAGFPSYLGSLATLERALLNFLLDTHTRLFGYKEVVVPHIVNDQVLSRTGHLPRFEPDLYLLDPRHNISEKKLYLIPTAEIPLIALFGGKKLDASQLPFWLCASTPCFRSEIQDYGRLTRGLIRQHQFNKVELVCLCLAEESEICHQLMQTHIEFVLKSLKLPYRAILLHSKGTCHTSRKTVDFEVNFPVEKKFIEVSSCSNTGGYQARELGISTKCGRAVHIINGSGLALGRVLSAILENRQLGDGRIRLPEILGRYLGSENFGYEVC